MDHHVMRIATPHPVTHCSPPDEVPLRRAGGVHHVDARAVAWLPEFVERVDDPDAAGRVCGIVFLVVRDEGEPPLPRSVGVDHPNVGAVPADYDHLTVGRPRGVASSLVLAATLSRQSRRRSPPRPAGVLV